MNKHFTEEQLAELYKAKNGSITDTETIRKIAMFCIENPGHNALTDKVNKMCHFAGLYPHVMKTFNILPDPIKK